jgi:uncharacterized protein involved in response to NO
MNPGPLPPDSPSTSSPGWWSLLAAGEPFRLLFPLGTAIGVLGVLLWPAHAWGLLPAYPGPWHARIMIEGFLTSFVLGFLGTSLPRLLGAPPVQWGETLGFAGAVVVLTALHACGETFSGDQIFLLTLLMFTGLLGIRLLLFRRDVPPPSFVLVALGLLCALAGVSLQLAAHVMASSFPPALHTLGRLLLHQGYLLFPVMGVGAFLLPRFFGLPGKQDFPESATLPPGWRRRAAFAFFCGAVVLSGFVLESLGSPRWGNILRAAGVLLFVLREIPFHRAAADGGSLVLALRVALCCVPLSFALMAAWPLRASPLLHVLFITGFSLLTFTVATRVILGHSGQSHRFRARLVPVLVLLALVSLAMLTRVSADWMPDTRILHYAYAGLSWTAGVLVWAVFILPAVRRPDTE